MILINEGQFFENLYNNIHNWVDIHKKHVYICGLDGDFKRKPFGNFLNLIPLSDKVTKLTSCCKNCKKFYHKDVWLAFSLFWAISIMCFTF